MDCRMATALRHFEGCVDLCDAHGLTRIAVSNRIMMGHCRTYTCDFDAALSDMRLGLETAVRIGNRHAEMFANQSLGFCLTAAGRYAEAADVQPKALEQARALKARRYQAVTLAHCAEVALCNGRKAEALALAREGREISNETGPGFVGPILYGLLALLEDRREDQEISSHCGDGIARARLRWAQPLLVPTLRDRTGIAFRGLGRSRQTGRRPAASNGRRTTHLLIVGGGTRSHPGSSRTRRWRPTATKKG